VNILNYILGIPAAFAQVSSNAASDVSGQTGNELAKLVANVFQQIPLWIVAIIVSVASYLVAIAVRRSIELKLSKEGIEEEHREIQIIAGRTAFFGTLTLGITIALSIVGIDLKPIVAAGAFGLGFALQDIIMNLIAGMMILAARHFTIGDVITVGAVTGKIVEIQTRATIIKGFDGTKVIVPNAELFSNVVISKTSNPFRKISFVMGVGYGSDLKKVMALTLAVVNSIPWVLKKPKSSVIFSAWGDSTIDFKINVWIDSKGGKFVKVKNRVIMDLTTAYDEAGVVIPYPIQTILMDKGDQAEIDQDAISKKMNQIKEKYKAKSLSREQAAAIVTAASVEQAPGGQTWLQNAFKQVSQLNNPQTMVAEAAVVAPAPTITIEPIPMTVPVTAPVEQVPAALTPATPNVASAEAQMITVPALSTAAEAPVAATPTLPAIPAAEAIMVSTSAPINPTGTIAL
jgi:small-conductance mechanosensitive channel